MSLTFLTMRLKDALGDPFLRVIGRRDDGSVVPVNVEDAEQRATLLGALAPLAGTLSIGLPDGAANAARQDLQLALLAGTSGLGQSGKTPVAVTRTTAGTSPAFTPLAGRTMNLLCAGGSGVVAQLERSFDGGATWYVKISDALRAVTPETFTDTETEVGVQYRWNVTAIGSGTVTLRISQ